MALSDIMMKDRLIEEEHQVDGTRLFNFYLYIYLYIDVSTFLPYLCHK